MKKDTRLKTKNDIINKIEDIVEEQIIGKSFDTYPEIKSIFRDKKDSSISSKLLDVCRYNDKALNNLIEYFNTFFKEELDFDSLNEDAKTWCYSAKWKKGCFKFTPFPLGNKMINDYYNSKLNVYNNTYKDEKILIVSDFTFFLLLVFYYHVDYNYITICIDSDFEEWLYEYFGIKEENVYKVDKWKNILETENNGEKLKMKHFDVVFTNPPYNDSLDLTLINILIEKDIADEIIAVHPTSFIFNKRLLNDKNKMKKQLESVDIFWGNKLFNIGLFVPVCISKWNKNNNNEMIHVVDRAYSNDDYDIEFEKIHYHGKRNEEIFELKNHIENYMKEHYGSIIDHHIEAGYKNMTKYSVRFAAVRGNTGQGKDGCKEDFWTLITSEGGSENKCNETFRYSKDINDTSYANQMTLWSFKNDIEQENFITYCKTKIVRFLLTFTKFNANLIASSPTKIIPWMDFKQTWTDEKLCKEFKISKDLWDYIDKFIPNYYKDYKTAVRGNI